MPSLQVLQVRVDDTDMDDMDVVVVDGGGRAAPPSAMAAAPTLPESGKSSVPPSSSSTSKHVKKVAATNKPPKKPTQTTTKTVAAPPQPPSQQTKLSQFFVAATRRTGAPPKRKEGREGPPRRSPPGGAPPGPDPTAVTPPPPPMANVSPTATATTTSARPPSPPPSASTTVPTTTPGTGARPPRGEGVACVSHSDRHRKKSQLRAIVLGTQHQPLSSTTGSAATTSRATRAAVPVDENDDGGGGTKAEDRGPSLGQEAAATATTEAASGTSTPVPVQTLLSLFDRQRTAVRSSGADTTTPTNSTTAVDRTEEENRTPNALLLPQPSETMPHSPNKALTPPPCTKSKSVPPTKGRVKRNDDGVRATKNGTAPESSERNATAGEAPSAGWSDAAVAEAIDGCSADDVQDDHDDVAIVPPPLPMDGSALNSASSSPSPAEAPDASDATPGEPAVVADEVVALVAVQDAAPTIHPTDSETPPELSPKPKAVPSSTAKKKSRRRRIAPTAVVVATVVAVETVETPVPEGSIQDDPPSPSVDPTVAPTPPAEPPQLCPEAEEEARHLQALRDRYAPCLQDLERRGRDLPRAIIPVPPLPAANDANAEADNAAVPDAALPTVVALVEGRTESLSDLATEVLEHLRLRYPHLTLEAVQLKIQVLATRTKPPVQASAKGDGMAPLPGIWEVATLDLLPTAAVPHIKQARAQRKRLTAHLRAVSQLLEAANGAGIAAKGEPSHRALKIAQLEERVLKFERDDEKLRLVELAREAQKQAQEELKAQKHEEKERRKSLERERKQQAALLKEEAKKQKKQQGDGKQKKQQGDVKAQTGDATLSRQKACFKSFFSKSGPATKEAPIDPRNASDECKTDLGPTAHEMTVPSASSPIIRASLPACPVAAPRGGLGNLGSATSFDVEAFRSGIREQAAPGRPFARPSLRSRRRRSRQVPLSVTVTVLPTEDEGPASAFAGVLPFAERRKVWINNRLRFFSFHEDVRPPYHGTWSKRSRAVSGRNPFGRDVCLDYDNDSEAEWEEEEETGEDVDVDDADEEEEDSGEQDETDGWLDNDVLRSDASNELVVCLVAPVNGIPLCETSLPVDPALFVEGYAIEEGLNLLVSHSAIVLNDSPVCLRFFPSDGRDGDGEGDRKKDDLSDDDLRSVCSLVHHSRFGSRDKVVDELRSRHPSTTHSRSHALRVLESIAEKKKDANGVYYWEVKKDVLENLRMQDLLGKELACTDVIDREKAKSVASFVHHSTLTSKDKLVEEVRTQCAVSSKAEAQRLLDSVAQKKKVNGSVYWSVKEDAQLDLGLDSLPSTPPPVARTAELSLNGSVSKASPVSAVGKRKTPEKPGSSEGKAKKRLSVDSSSAKMLAMFLKKRKS